MRLLYYSFQYNLVMNHCLTIAHYKVLYAAVHTYFTVYAV